MHDLTKRQKDILQVVINLYLEGVKEISSLFLDSLHIFSISSATIRHELSILTQKGYLTKTHYASGRKPTLKAIQLYINNLYSAPQNPLIHMYENYASAKQQNCSQFLDNILRHISKKFKVSTFMTSKYRTNLYNLAFLINASAKILNLEPQKQKYYTFLDFITLLENPNQFRSLLTRSFPIYNIHDIAINYLYNSNSELPHILIAFLPYKCKRTEFIGIIGFLNYTFIQAIQQIIQIPQIILTYHKKQNNI